ncbi:MAG: F0F1 ATP synthase subunit delta [Mariprofundaceae bacterium]
MSTRAISRRYARALFDLANEGDAAVLEKGLSELAEAVADKELVALLGNPRFSSEVKVNVLTRVVKGLNAELTNLVGLLCQRDKVMLLPEIVQIYEDLKREFEAEAIVKVASATRINAELQARLAKVISDDLGKKVRLELSEDKNLIGGMVIRIGDRQIDHSLRGKLEGLRRAVAA